MQAAAEEGRHVGRRDRRDLLWAASEQHQVQAISKGTEPIAPPEKGHGMCGTHGEEVTSRRHIPWLHLRTHSRGPSAGVKCIGPDAWK